eukprot:m.31648 g.31648  ORF g.31648 m.31648 type:complete len:97 (+) comp12089_c0_seq12:1275-1565(+)
MYTSRVQGGADGWEQDTQVSIAEGYNARARNMSTSTCTYQPSSIPRATATATVNMKEKLTYWFRNCDIQLSIFGCNTSLACKQSEHLKAAPTYTVT